MGLSAGSSLKYILFTDTNVTLYDYFWFGLGCNMLVSFGLAAFDQVRVFWGQGLTVADIPLQLCL